MRINMRFGNPKRFEQFNISIKFPDKNKKIGFKIVNWNMEIDPR